MTSRRDDADDGDDDDEEDDDGAAEGVEAAMTSAADDDRFARLSAASGTAETAASWDEGFRGARTPGGTKCADITSSLFNKMFKASSLGLTQPSNSFIFLRASFSSLWG